MGPELAEMVALLFYVAIVAALAWAGGYAVAEDSWWADNRARFEDWAYVDGQKVRDNHPEADDFWDRARPWLIRPEPAPPTAQQVVGDVAAANTTAGTEVIRDARRPARRVNWFATVARTKVADMLGCPICSGWWASLAVALPLLVWWGPWDLSWGLLGAHFAGWGVAHRIGWE